MKRLLYQVGAILFLLFFGADSGFAGGPLIVATNGQPVRWARNETRGGPLDSATVDAQGRIVYRVDQGPLGPLSNAEAAAIVDRIFKLYTDIPTASIEFVNGGPILDPNTRQPVDITGSNAGLFLSGKSPTFQNPIIFDSDGSIMGQGGTLGFFNFLNFSQTIGTPDLLEATVIINGPAIRSLGKIPFQGILTHEVGHFAGPLDHSQIYGWIASGDKEANIPVGFTPEKCYDIFAPFVESVYPFLVRSPLESRLGSRGFTSSGAFLISLNLDDVIAMSTLYPESGFFPTDPGSMFGGISGRVIIRTSDGSIPITGINVIARRISKGRYPPRPDIEIYPVSGPKLDSDNYPLPPDYRDEMDPLITATSLVSGAVGGAGEFNFVGLPPGDYMISIERLNPAALLASAIGPKNPQLELARPENYNGENENEDPVSDKETDFTPIKVSAGSVVSGIEIALNGLGGMVKNAEEHEPNDKKGEAQELRPGMRITGSATGFDTVKTRIEFPPTESIREDGVEDLYRVELDDASSLFIILEGADQSANFDLYLFSSNFKKRMTTSSPSIVNLSDSAGGVEVISTKLLDRGTYYIGASILKGSGRYTLTILKQR